MNLNFAWMPPAQVFFKAMISPFSSFNRPTGAAYYRTCFAFFGWNPFAFRAVTYCLMIVNIGLVFILARRILGSRIAGLCAGILFSFHGRFWHFYISNGAVYDVICVFFTLLLLIWYVRLRIDREAMTAGRAAGLTGLFFLALNAKEMAAVVPVLMLLLDWFYAASAPRASEGRFGRILARSWLPLTLCVITAISIHLKTGKGTLFSEDPLYANSFTVERFLSNCRSLYSELFYFSDQQLTAWQSLIPLFSLFLIALLCRSRILWWLACFAFLAPLPVMFIGSRGFFVMYLPMVAWAIYVATLLMMLRDRVSSSARVRQIVNVAMVALCVGIAVHGKSDPEYLHAQTDPLAETITETVNDFMRLKTPMPSGGAIYMPHSRFAGDAFAPWMIARMLYLDRDLTLRRPFMLPSTPTDAELQAYDRVIDFDGRGMRVIAVHGGRRPAYLPTTDAHWWDEF